jgi:hypothetical protein
MQFAKFIALSAGEVASIVAQKTPDKLGVGIPINGTRRWYLATYQKQPMDLFGPDYAPRVTHRMWDIARMMFDDGVSAIYLPLIGRALAERGPEYMAFAAQSVRSLADENAVGWYLANDVAASCYGEIDLLPTDIQDLGVTMSRRTKQGKRLLRYGIFADRPQPDLIARTIRLHQELGAIPTEQQLGEDYYHGPYISLGFWIGSDQPTLFDVPLVVGGHTALYFLQFPTLYLDHGTWRRLLYDYLYIRGDEEALYPDNIPEERQIVGLGARQDGYWRPSNT